MNNRFDFFVQKMRAQNNSTTVFFQDQFPQDERGPFWVLSNGELIQKAALHEATKFVLRLIGEATLTENNAHVVENAVAERLEQAVNRHTSHETSNFMERQLAKELAKILRDLRGLLNR